MGLTFTVLNCGAVENSYVLIGGSGNMCTVVGTSIYKQAIIANYQSNRKGQRIYP